MFCSNKSSIDTKFWINERNVETNKEKTHN